MPELAELLRRAEELEDEKLNRLLDRAESLSTAVAEPRWAGRMQRAANLAGRGGWGPARPRRPRTGGPRTLEGAILRRAAGDDPEFEERGRARYLANRIPFSPSEPIYLAQLYLAAKRHRAGKSTPEDLALIADYIVAAEANRDKSWGRKVLDLVTSLPKFGIEFAVTAGAYSATRKGVEAGAEKLAAKTLEKSVAGRVATGLASRTAGVGVQTALMPNMISEDIVRRLVPKMGLDKDNAGRLKLILQENDEDFAKSVGLGILDSLIELASERTGGRILRLPFVRGLKGAIAKRFLGRGRTVAEMESILKRAGWHGLLGELAEERVAEVPRGLLGVTEDYGVTGALAADPLSPEAWEQISIEAAAFAVPGAVTGVSGALANGRERAIQEAGRKVDAGGTPSRKEAEKMGAPPEVSRKAPQRREWFLRNRDRFRQLEEDRRDRIQEMEDRRAAEIAEPSDRAATQLLPGPLPAAAGLEPGTDRLGVAATQGPSPEPSQAQAAPPAAEVEPQGRERLERLRTLLEEQAGRETSPDGKWRAAVAVMNKQTPEVAGDLLEHLRTIAPEALEYAAKNPRSVPIGLRTRIQEEPPGKPFTAVPKPRSKKSVRKLPTRSTRTMASGEITEVSPKDIKIDSERFQFKGEARKTGVVEPLAGEWNPAAAGVGLLWEDSKGQLWAVNYHHRLDLAKRRNVPTVDVRVVKETEGVSEKDARSMGAMLNILEGQGKVDDYAEFFRETQVSEEDAEKEGLLARAKGQTGFVLGRFASEDVWAAYRGNKISAGKAAVISDVGRGDEGLQAAGLERARKPGSVEELRHLLDMLKRFPRQETPIQGDFFGFDDSAITEAEKISRAVARIVKGLKDRLLAVKGALRRPETAKEMGLEGDFESIQREVNLVEEELAGWDHWTTSPELIRQAREVAGLSVSEAFAAEPPAEIEAPGGRQLKEAKLVKADLALRAVDRPLGQGGAAGSPEQIGMAAEMEGTGERIGARDVIEGIERLTRIPIRAGRLRGKNLRGRYKVIWQNARMKGAESASVDVALHETAHGIDAATDVRTSASLEAKAELRQLDYKPEKKRPMEGFAEYVRGYLSEDIDVEAEAPMFHRHFLAWLAENPKWEKAIGGSKALVDRFRAAGALGRVKAQISRTGKKEAVPWKEQLPHWINQTYEKMKEQGWYGYLFEKDLRSRGYMPKKGASFMDKYKAFTQGGAVLANTALESGVFTLGRDGVMKRIGPSLWDAMEKVSPAEYDTWSAWAYARHALESWQKGKAPGITKADAQYVYDLFKDNQGWQEAADAVTAFNKSLIDMLADMGVITAESAEWIKEAYKTYLPLHRIVPDKFGKRASAGVRLVDLPSPIKRRFGSGYKIIDPIQTTVQQAVLFYERAANQLVINEMVRAAEEHGAKGWIERLPPNLQKTAVSLEEVWPAISETLGKTGLSEEDIDRLEAGMDKATAEKWRTDMVNIYRPNYWDRSGQPVANVILEGKRALFYFQKDLHQAVSGMGYFQLPKILEMTFARMTRMVRLGATTLNLTFALGTNFLRDMPTYLIQRNYGGKLDPMAWVGTYAYSEFQRRRGAKEDPYVKLWRQYGGPLSSVLGLDRASTRRAVASAVAGQQKFGAVESIIDAVQVCEAGPRLAEFAAVWKSHGYTRADVAKMIEDGKTPANILIEALNASHEVTVDFRRLGTWGRWFNRLVPFSNARLEGIDKSVRTVKDNPGRSFIRYFAYCAVPSIVYWFLHRDDDWYKEREDWLNSYWVITDEDGKPVGRIPRGHEIAQVGAGIEAILDALYKKNPQAIERWAGYAWKQTRPGFNVSGANVLLEVAMNWDFFRDRPIVPKSQQHLQPRDQLYPYNTAIMKTIGSWLNVSPAKLEHAVNSATGGFYRRYTSPVESWWTGDPLSPPDIPIVQGFVFRAERTRSVDEFYKLSNKTQREYHSAKLGGRSASDELTGQYRKLGRYRDLISNIRKLNENVENRDKRWENERYIAGLARMATGKEELARYPNPFTADDLPPAVKEVRDSHLGTVAHVVAETMDLRRAKPETKLGMKFAIEYLRETGISEHQLSLILAKKLRKSRRSGKSIREWQNRLRRRL